MYLSVYIYIYIYLTFIISRAITEKLSSNCECSFTFNLFRNHRDPSMLYFGPLPQKSEISLSNEHTMTTVKRVLSVISTIRSCPPIQRHKGPPQTRVCDIAPFPSPSASTCYQLFSLSPNLYYSYFTGLY